MTGTGWLSMGVQRDDRFNPSGGRGVSYEATNDDVQLVGGWTSPRFVGLMGPGPPDRRREVGEH